jgi:hypothetical protein
MPSSLSLIIACALLSFVWVAAFRPADPPFKESYRLSKKDYKTEEEARAQQKAVEPLLNE